MAQSQYVRVYRSWRAVIFRLLLALFIGFVGVVLAEQTSFFNAHVPFGTDREIELPLFFLLFLILIARPVILLYDEHCDISEHHVRHVFGKCSTHRREVSVPVEELRGVRVDQTLLERILGIGTVVAWTQAGSNPEIRVRGIAHPQQTAQQIMDRIDQSQIAKKDGR